MSIKRTIILSDDINKSSRAILTLECDDFKTCGEIRLFGAEICPKIALGIKNGEKPVIKIPLETRENFARFETQEVVDCDKRIFCALVDIEDLKNPQVLISGCNFGGDKVNDVVEIAFFNNEKISKENMYEIDEDVVSLVDENLKEDEDFEDCTKCVNCKYRKCFYEEENEVKTETTTNTKEENEDAFYNDIKSQIEDLFKIHDEDKTLKTLIPNSKWVRVKFEDGINYYVLGLIYENDIVSYIVYGLPADNNKKPPEDLKEYAQWLPLDINNPEEKGYWLVYQSAKSGESVVINVV